MSALSSSGISIFFISFSMLLDSSRRKDCTKKQVNATNHRTTMLKQSRPFVKQAYMKRRWAPLNASTSFPKVGREDKESFHQGLPVLSRGFVTIWQTSISSEGKHKKWKKSSNISRLPLIALLS